MTSKDALKERVDQLSEREAAAWLSRLEWEFGDADELSEPELADLREAERDVAAGHVVDGERLLRKLGV